MRIVHNPQLTLGQIDIADIKLDPKCRDDIPSILMGLQKIYTDPELHHSIFQILEQIIPKRNVEGLMDEECGQNVSSTQGRPGMAQWKILVLGVLRLGLNTDFDRIHDLANNHNTLRQMLGHSDDFDDSQYSLQSIKDNLMLLTPEILDQINQEVIKAGHQLIKKNQKEGQAKKGNSITDKDELHGRCDSFVVETDVHFPTDISLLFDAVRKVIDESASLAEQYELLGWRQSKYNIRQLKKQYRKIQKLKHSTSKDKAKKQKRDEQIKQEHEQYIIMSATYLTQSEQLIATLKENGAMDDEVLQLQKYLYYISLFNDQIDRRVIQGETIPHSEKVFSIFGPHTEWINKGKAGVPVELGLRVCVMVDQYQFILHSMVMEKLTDDKVAVEMVEETKKRFSELTSCSFDKGFHSPSNQKDLKDHLEHVVLPKKGRLSKADKLREESEEFKAKRKKHSGVESAINGLEQGGLDVCPDHGIDGFKRYVSLAVVSRNIKRLGTLVRQQAQEKEDRKRGQYKKAA